MSNIGTKFNLANKFSFDPNTNSLIDTSNDDFLIRMGSNESRILLFLAERPNQVVSRHQLYDFVWREQGFEVDDSSLTQAISTLRKLLNDSTKSPEFVKTVPKRGYQLICTVERITANNCSENLVSFQAAEELPVDPIPEPESDLSPEIEREVDVSETPIAPSSDEAKPNHSWLTKVALILAVALPFLAIMYSQPSASEFRQLTNVSGVVVKTPLHHPDLTNWLPAIEQCVTRYKNNHAGDFAPVEVIATGGQNHQLVLNYIHQLQHSGENITIRIFSDPNHIDQICQ